MSWLSIQVDSEAVGLLAAAWPLTAGSEALHALAAHQLAGEDTSWISNKRDSASLAAILEELAGAPEILGVALELPADQQIPMLAVAGLMLIDESAPAPILQKALKTGCLPEMNRDSTELLALSQLAASIETAAPESSKGPPEDAPMLGTLVGLEAGDGWENVPPFCGRIFGDKIYFKDE
ncbi:MAG: hypothetical protein ACI9VR_002476 [Cognaticolwellia sp.]|jgi:hypothetical protein